MDDTINNSARLIPCSFCDKEFSSSAIGEHLMMCGNKTDQCPNCRKYIRRAIFAYHYENNCANLEESDADVRAPANQPDTPSTFQPNNPSQPPSRSPVENNKYRTEMKVDLPAHSGTQDTAVQRFGSVKTTIVCPYCGLDCNLAESEAHQENCLRNPVNIKRTQLPSINGTSNQEDRSNHADQLNNATTVPCDVCKEPIEWRDFEEHLKFCVEREQERRQNQSRSNNRENDTVLVRCRYCNEERFAYNLSFHEKLCQTSRKVLDDQAYKRAFNLPPLQN